MNDIAVVLYSTRFCPYCIAARRFLKAKSVEFEDIAVDGDHQLRQEISDRSGQHTVPQIWIGERHIGGFTDMQALERSGELDVLLDTMSGSSNTE
ncbi:MAG: glutaredoxin 3 [Porticoccaceae bacterium]